MQFSIYDVFYSQNSQQHVSAGIPAILRAILLYKNAKLQITPHRPNNFKSKDLHNYPFLAYIYIKSKGKVTPKQAYVALRGPGG
jgi:hypothetical protein